MKKSSNYIIVLIIGMWSLFACKRALDINPNDASKYAKIQTIHLQPSSEYYSNRWVTFNEKGEPVSSITNSYSTGDPNEQYTYHSNGQLKERILFFGETPDSYQVEGNNVFILYTYAYDKKGRIIADTNHYIGGNVIDENRSIQYYNEYTYDSQSRIIAKKMTFVPFPYEETEYYNYDHKGNLEGFEYDNKLNPLRLSKVLAFIANDFSVNNRIGENLQYEYNEYGLPTKISGSSNLLAMLYSAGVHTIQYSKK